MWRHVTIAFSFLTELEKKYHTCKDCFTSKICYPACKSTLPGQHWLQLVKFPSKVTSLATVSAAPCQTGYRNHDCWSCRNLLCGISQGHNQMNDCLLDKGISTQWSSDTNLTCDPLIEGVVLNYRQVQAWISSFSITMCQQAQNYTAVGKGTLWKLSHHNMVWDSGRSLQGPQGSGQGM
jgi:hypothetical protein